MCFEQREVLILNCGHIIQIDTLLLKNNYIPKDIMTSFPCCINLLVRASILRKVTILSISLNNRQPKQKQIVRNLFEQTLTSYS